MKKMMMFFIMMFTVGLLVACGDEEAQLSDKEVKELVHEYTIGEFAETVSASIDSQELIVTEDGEETTYDLPKDEFFVSIAPFETFTHDCAIHSLTGCQGELVEDAFDVKITSEDGEVIVDEEMESFANGFIDLWLPRDGEYTVEIAKDGKVSEQTISTFENDYTCITTMQLL